MTEGQELVEHLRSIAETHSGPGEFVPNTLRAAARWIEAADVVAGHNALIATPSQIAAWAAALGALRAHTMPSMEGLGWNLAANLRWLADQSGRPGYVPCGMLTGAFLLLAAQRLESLVERVNEPNYPAGPVTPTELKTRPEAALQMLETLIQSQGEAFVSERDPAQLIAIVRGGLGGDIVPGVLSCALCKFRLIKTTLTPRGAFANDEPDRCPNCDVPMWRVTWREEAKEAYAVAETQMERALRAERAQADTKGALQAIVDFELGSDPGKILLQQAWAKMKANALSALEPGGNNGAKP